MKQLIALMMCFQFIVAPVALAEEKKETNKNAGDQFRENPEAKAKKGGDYFQMIIGVGTSVIGATSAVSCMIKYPSIMIFAAGSLIHIMSEITGGKEHSDYLKKKAADLKMSEEKLKAAGGGGEVQKQALEDALASEKETLSYINKKKKWASLLMLVYAAATAAAIAEKLSLIGNIPAGCNPATTLASSKIMATAIATAYSFLSGGMVQALLSGLATYFIAGSTSIITMLNTAVTRIVVFGMTTIVQKTVVSSLDKKAKVAKENIEKLEKALAEFNKNTTATNGLASTDTTTTTSGSESGSNTVTGNTSNIKTLPTTAEVNRICASSNGADISTKACATPLKLAGPKFDASLKVPTLASFGQGVTDVANQMASGDLAGAEVGAAALTSQAARINQIRDNAMKQLNDKLKAEGKKPIDIEADAKAQFAAMSNSLKANDADMANALAALGNGSTSLPDDLKGEADIKGTVQNVNATDANSGAGASVAPTSGTLGTMGSIEDTSGIATEDASKEVEDMMKKDEFEFAQEDVRKDKETSLFNMLSTRYLLNYPKFFKKEAPATTPAAEPVKKETN